MGGRKEIMIYRRSEILPEHLRMARRILDGCPFTVVKRNGKNRVIVHDQVLLRAIEELQRKDKENESREGQEPSTHNVVTGSRSRASLGKGGRVTIPRAVRELLGLEVGQKLEVEVADGGAILLRPVSASETGR